MRTCFFALALWLFACSGKAVIDGNGDRAGEGGAVGGGQTGGSGGQPSCDALTAQFATAMVEAKQCNPLVNTLQCTLEIKSALRCGCPTFVNPGNASAVDTLKQLETQWQSMGCALPTPCPSSCPAPQGSGCVQDGSASDSGRCQDFFG